MSDKLPDEKDSLTETFKKLLAPIAGFMGVVTLIYNFYKLWLENQGTVTYITAILGLTTTLAISGWVGFSMQITTRPAVWPMGVVIKEKHPRYSASSRLISRIIFITIVFGSFIGGWQLETHRQGLNDKFIVVIARFDGPEEIYGFSNAIIEDLKSRFESSNKIEIISADETVYLTDAIYAQELGKIYYADVVVWGWYRPTENPHVTIHIENIGLRQPSAMAESIIISPPITLVDLETFQGSNLVTPFLVDVIQYRAGDDLAALSRIDKILANNFQAQNNESLNPGELTLTPNPNADLTQLITETPGYSLTNTQQFALSPTPVFINTPTLTPTPSWFVETYQENRNDSLFWVFTTILGLLLTYLLGIGALLISAWRFGSNIFSRSWLTALASKPLLVIPGLSSWALFLGYKERLLNLPDIKRVSNTYFGLPAFDAAGNDILPDSNGKTLHIEISKSLGYQKPVFIVTKGGGGKTTLLARWAYLAVTDKLPSQLKDFKPVFVSSAYYSGNLIDAITSTLRERDGVAVDKNIIQAQFESGKFLILFDGVSEIEGDQNKGLQEILRTAQSADYRNCRFVITTRPGLNIPPEITVFHLQPLTSDVILNLLPLYHLGIERNRQVKEQLKAFGSKPIDPLLFSMILEQGSNAQVSLTRSQLYEKYFRRLLRESNEIIWNGWSAVLGEFSNWFTLETGRRGIGIIHEKMVNKISDKTNDKKNENLLEKNKRLYGLPIGNELDLLEKLKACSIMQYSKRWRFAHDTFEEYFAACYIISYMTSHERLPSLNAWTISDAQIQSFVGIIEFIKEMVDSESLKILLDSNLPILWVNVLTSTENIYVSDKENNKQIEGNDSIQVGSSVNELVAQDFGALQDSQFPPLFISYSHGDTAFVDKLEKGLNEKGVRFWRDIHDAVVGRLEIQIDQAIRQNSTVLLILSKNSMNSDWVQHEVRKAREFEKELGRDALCPIALDDSWKSSRWPQRIMEQVMEYNILDFSQWEDEGTFNVKFGKLLSGLDLFYKKPEK